MGIILSVGIYLYLSLPVQQLEFVGLFRAYNIGQVNILEMVPL